MILELKKDRITLNFWSVEQIFSVYQVDISSLQYFDGHFSNKVSGVHEPLSPLGHI